MTRVEQLENRLENLKEVRDFYLKGEKVNGKIYPNPKSGKYANICAKIKKEIRLLSE